MPNKDLNTNEVIVNGQVIMTTRNDTVTPQTLVKDETATNKEGAKIRGELDPVSHDEAYLIDDPEGDIDDNDYIPFNDVSDEEQPKKKTLFSSIVDKLRTIFVSKSWGHVELLSTTETLGIKDKEVDATASDNSVTANHYPSSNDIRDNNNKIIARSEAIVYPSGTITAKMYAQNYDANGNSVGQNAINLNVDKSGVFSYNVSDPNAFRSAIKTVDQLGTDIPENADLNTYKTAGTYRVPSDAIGATISNLPLALCGKVVVFNNGNGGFEQFYFPNHSPRIFVRTWWSNAWSTWKEIGEGGGDSKAHTYEMGTNIPANSDFDDYKTEGVYYVLNATDASTISNIPVSSAGKLIVMDRDTGVRLFQIYMISRDEIYIRDMSNNSDFSVWRNITSKHTYELGTDILSDEDLNSYTTAGVYRIASDTIASSLTNSPTTIGGKLLVLYQSNQSNLKVAIQIYIETTTNRIYKRRYNSSLTTKWNDWTTIGFELLNQKASIEISNVNLDTLFSIGFYSWSQGNSSTITNRPFNITEAGLLYVLNTWGNTTFWKQIVFSRDSLQSFERICTNGSTWSAWKQLAFTDDISPSTVGNGYAVATVSGSAITATISGFQLRAGVIVAIKTGVAIPVNATLNINNTGAKSIQCWGSIGLVNVRLRDLRQGGIYSFIYTGSVYIVLSYDSCARLLPHAYVADTSGDISIEGSYDQNAFQIKYNLGSDRLYWNFVKNNAWNGDRRLAQEAEDGVVYLNRETTTADDKYVGLRAYIKDTTTDKSYERNVLRAYQDHQATPYGFNLLIDSGGNTVIGSGEAANEMYSNNYINKTAEDVYIVADGGVFIVSNANTIANRTGFKLVGGKLYPIKAEVNTDNFGDLGLSQYKLANVFTYKINGANAVNENDLGASVAKVGKNILPSWGYNSNIYSANGLTFTFNPSTGEITVNGTATADTFCKLAGESYSQYTIPKGIYILTGCPSGGSDTKYKLYLQVVKKGTSSMTNYNDFGNGCDVNLDIDSYSGLTSMWGIIVRSGQTLSNLVFKPMLRPAFTTAEYEPCEDIHKGNCYVGTCPTAGATKDKEAYVDGYFVLRKGVRVAIKFSNTNTANSTTANPITLNVNNTGAKYIWRWQNHTGAQDAGTDTIIFGVAGRYNFYIYDGTYWVWAGASGDNNSTNFLRNDASSTMTTSTPVLTLKASNIDLTQANNGVTSTQYPAYTIVDKNGKTMARFEAITETNGNISSFLYAGNIKTSDGTHFNGGIKLIAKKDGSFTWNITGDKASFHNNIGIGYCACSTAEATLAKTANLKDYALCHGSIVVVHFANKVPANSTLNINGQGAKAIYYRGNAIQANMILGGDRAIFAYDNYYHLIGIDRNPQKYVQSNSSGIISGFTAGTDITISQMFLSYNGNVVTVSFAFKFNTAKTLTSNTVVLSGFTNVSNFVFFTGCTNGLNPNKVQPMYINRDDGKVYIRGTTVGTETYWCGFSYIRS